MHDRLSKLFKETNTSYMKNLDKVILFSIPMLVAFIIPYLVSLPTFPAIGGIFLRLGSLPDITSIDIGIMVLSYLVSLYLMSWVIVSINIIIKSQRTNINIKKEVIKGMKGYTLNMFFLYLLMTLIWFAVQLITYDIAYRNVITPLLIFLIVVPFFYAPSALVIDKVSPEKAVYRSVKHVIRKPLLFILWLVVGVIMLSVLDLVLYAVVPDYAAWLFLIINSLLISPYLIVLQINMYISKYSIIG